MGFSASFFVAIFLITCGECSFECSSSTQTYQHSSFPSWCPRSNFKCSLPLHFPPLDIIGESNISYGNLTAASSGGYSCEEGLLNETNCVYVENSKYVEFGGLSETFIITSFSSGETVTINTLSWIMLPFHKNFRVNFLEIVKKNSEECYILLCDKTVCYFYNMDNFGNVSYIFRKKIVNGRNISSISHIIQPSTENIFILYTLNNSMTEEIDVIVHSLAVGVGEYLNEEEIPFPTSEWILPNSESQYRLQIFRQYLNYNESSQSFFSEVSATKSQDLVLFYNDKSVYIFRFENSSITSSSNFACSLFFEIEDDNQRISSVRGISQSILRFDYQKSNCSTFVRREYSEPLQLLIIYYDSNLSMLCDSMKTWNGTTGCKERDYTRHEIENVEFLDRTEIRFSQHITNNAEDEDGLGMSNLCSFFVSSQRIHGDVDQSLMEECLRLFNTTYECEIESFKSNNEVRRWILYNSWNSQIFLFSTKNDFITLYYGMKVDKESVYFEYPYSYSTQIMTETKLRGEIIDSLVSKNGFHVFVSHVRRRWELESIMRRRTICLLLMNRTIARKIKENLQNELMIDLVDEIRDRCEDNVPKSVSMSDFGVYFSSIKYPGYYAPYFEKNFLSVPRHGMFSQFPLHLSSCKPGFYCIDGTASICPSGFYCGAISSQPSFCTHDEKKFKTCFFKGNTNNVGLPCPIGNICPLSYHDILPVPPGFQQNISSFLAYIEYYVDIKNVTVDGVIVTNDTLNINETNNITVSGNVSVTVNVSTDSLSPNSFFECELGEWCPLYIFFDNLCPAGTECQYPSKLLPSPCNYTLPDRSNMYGLTQYCPNGTHSAQLCPEGHACAGPLEIRECDPHFHCPAGTIMQVVCPGGYFCPTPGEKFLCPWFHFCKSGSIQPKRCSILSICPPGMQYDRYNFVGIILIGGVAVIVFILTKCCNRLSHKMKNMKKKKEAKNNWKDLGKMDFSFIQKMLGNTDISQSEQECCTEIFEATNSTSQAVTSVVFNTDDDVEELEEEEEEGEGESDVEENVLPMCASEMEQTVTDFLEQEEEEENDTWKNKKQPFRICDLFCFPCSFVNWIIFCRYLRRRKKNKTGFFVDLGFEDLSLTVKGNGKVVLNGVTGEILHGGVTAVMGLSGCGKSSFITTLAGKAYYGFQDGKIYINKIEQGLSKLKKFVGFVPQEDVMRRKMTVEENISFSARTRLDSSLSGREIRRKIDRVIELLGLEQIRSSIIGDENVRGISGGQRKRVNIALELVADPLVLFLDEPTSGLDSSSSQQVCDALKRIADEGILVVTVIHQPRFEIFEQFDTLLLLGVGGEIVYLGDVPDMLPYFESLGFILERKAVNPIDFAMDCVDGKVACRKGKESTWEQSEFFEKWKEKRDISHMNIRPSQSEARKIKKRIDKECSSRGTPSCRQLFECFRRAFVMKRRAWKTFISDNILILVGGIFLGALFIGEEYIGSLPKFLSDQCPSFIRIKCEIPVYDPLLKHSALISLIIALGGAMSSLSTFGSDRAEFLREQSTGLTTWIEFLARSTVDLINVLLSPWIFLGVYYTLKSPRGLLIYYVLILTGLQYSSYGYGYFISVLFNSDVSKIAGVVILLITFLFSGLNVTIASMKKWPIPINLIPWCCFLRYSTEALYLVEITRIKDFQNVDFGMEMYGFEFSDIYWCVGSLFGIGLLLRILSYVILVQSVPTSRWNSIKSYYSIMKYKMKKKLKKISKKVFKVLCCCCFFCFSKKNSKKNKMVSPSNEEGENGNPFKFILAQANNNNDDDEEEIYGEQEESEEESGESLKIECLSREEEEGEESSSEISSDSSGGCNV